MSGYSHYIYIFYAGWDNTDVRNNVKRRRKKQGLSQLQLAVRAGVGRSTISNIENNKYIPGVDIALLLARALQCRVEDLFNI